VGSRVFGDHVGVHLDLRNVGDSVEREGLADSHLPTPDVRDVTRPIGHPLFVNNLKVLESPTVRKKVEEATGGRAVYTGSRPDRIVVSKHKSPVDGHTKNRAFEHEPDLLDPRSSDGRGERPGLKKGPVVPELDSGIVKGQIVPLCIGRSTFVIKVEFGIVPGGGGVTLELTGPRVGEFQGPVFVFMVRLIVDEKDGVPGDRVQNGIRTDNFIHRQFPDTQGGIRDVQNALRCLYRHSYYRWRFF
jgi:hypothetical protein